MNRLRLLVTCLVFILAACRKNDPQESSYAHLEGVKAQLETRLPAGNLSLLT